MMMLAAEQASQFTEILDGVGGMADQVEDVEPLDAVEVASDLLTAAWQAKASISGLAERLAKRPGVNGQPVKPVPERKPIDPAPKPRPQPKPKPKPKNRGLADKVEKEAEQLRDSLGSTLTVVMAAITDGFRLAGEAELMLDPEDHDLWAARADRTVEDLGRAQVMLDVLRDHLTREDPVLEGVLESYREHVCEVCGDRLLAEDLAEHRANPPASCLLARKTAGE